MRRIKYFVMCIGDHWEVSCSLRDQPTTRHPGRVEALQAAGRAASALWEQNIASEVLIDEEDGEFHTVATYGDLLGF